MPMRDDAERAVRAGLDIVTGVKKAPATNEPPLACRLGIATGVVIVGDLDRNRHGTRSRRYR